MELVSVCMLAYNHEEWIGKAIQSIMNQKTSFEFKLYIHEDKSKDGTRDVVIKYAEKYPDQIKLILADENRYSKGVKIIPEIVVPLTKGKYIAFCEGDDYWIDCNKLQKQIEYLETHPECAVSFSNAKIVDLSDNVLREFLPQGIWNDHGINKKLKSGKEENFSAEEMILLDFVPTASLVYTRKIYDVYCNFNYSLDLLTRLLAVSYGYAHFHPECLTAYRTGNPNSASGVVQNSQRLKDNFFDLHLNILNEFDQQTDGRYHNAIEIEKKRKALIYELKIGNYFKVVKNNCFKDLNKKYFLKNIIRNYCNKPYCYIRKIKYRIKKV
ncbi:glycosyltransferase [Ruminococcus sp.]|uniref:glycosyltransferase n=1 Tax=Ruminococcus sp. TaxID=41978 RepID=UPI0025DF36EF|nr:glycosyltransferase [Ruminococcus sp.]MBR1432846.1 glycosyltransferase [Ruminococcus sp.]